MDIVSGDTKALFFHSKSGFIGWAYLTTFPGIIRISNVVLGALSLILCLCGFPHNYLTDSLEERYERRKTPRYRLTVDGRFDTFEYEYGAGYVSERPNVIQLICVTVCLVFSGLHILLLSKSPRLHDGASRAWNRFLNLSATIIYAVGTLNGIFGLLLFRSYCCHVEFIGNERHKSEMEGYFVEPCLCYITPLWEGNHRDENEYPTLYYSDIPEEIIFHSANPHHFIPHAISLFLMTINTCGYLIASIKI